ncbi:MAG: SIMPL domain-containing protein [Ilumatobacteraceae bacterium]
MNTRWVGVVVGGAVVGMLAVGAAAWVGRDDPKASIASPQPAPVAGTLVKSITVTGEGKIKVKPDTASLSLGVQSTATTATEALSQTNTSGAALIAALKAAGVSDNDIATSGLSIYPQYGTNSSVITGYQASNNVTVTVRDISQTGPVIDAAAAAAGDHITLGGVSFYIDDTEALIGAARKDAINNAMKRATEYATAAGVTVGGVVQISELSVNNPIPLMYAPAADSAAKGAAAPTPIETGTQDLTVSVTVVYQLT